MRIATSQTEFEAQLESAKRESMKAFGDDAVLLERYVQKPRQSTSLLPLSDDHKMNNSFLFLPYIYWNKKRY